MLLMMKNKKRRAYEARCSCVVAYGKRAREEKSGKMANWIRIATPTSHSDRKGRPERLLILPFSTYPSTIPIATAPMRNIVLNAILPLVLCVRNREQLKTRQDLQGHLPRSTKTAIRN